MESKLDEMLDSGDYYSAHQLILSLSKRKAKSGKSDEAVQFVKKSVVRLCKASQFASASDAACELLEHVKIENFSDAEELFEALFQSAEAQYWRAFMTAMNTHNLLDDASNRESLVQKLIYSPALGYDAEKLSSVGSFILTLIGDKRRQYLRVFAAHLAAEVNEETTKLQMYFVGELSLALIKATQFADCDSFLRAFSSAVNGKEAADEIVSPVESSSRALFNFCLLMMYLCQRRNPPKAVLQEILNEYLPEAKCKQQLELSKLRAFVETSLVETYWPAPRARMPMGMGGAPPDLLNMLQGLMGSQSARR